MEKFSNSFWKKFRRQSILLGFTVLFGLFYFDAHLFNLNGYLILFAGTFKPVLGLPLVYHQGSRVNQDLNYFFAYFFIYLFLSLINDILVSSSVNKSIRQGMTVGIITAMIALIFYELTILGLIPLLYLSLFLLTFLSWKNNLIFVGSFIYALSVGVGIIWGLESNFILALIPVMIFLFFALLITLIIALLNGKEGIPG